ncbi:hypothetical protein U1Q18_051714 [Sarracenia purpurea var. burkii]
MVFANHITPRSTGSGTGTAICQEAAGRFTKPAHEPEPVSGDRNGKNAAGFTYEYQVPLPRVSGMSAMVDIPVPIITSTSMTSQRSNSAALHRPDSGLIPMVGNARDKGSGCL